MRILFPNASILEGDMHTALGGGEDALSEMVLATLAGMTTGDFGKSVADWLRKPESRRGLPGTERRLDNPPPDRDGLCVPP